MKRGGKNEGRNSMEGQLYGLYGATRLKRTISGNGQIPFSYVGNSRIIISSRNGGLRCRRDVYYFRGKKGKKREPDLLLLRTG